MRVTFGFKGIAIFCSLSFLFSPQVAAAYLPLAHLPFGSRTALIIEPIFFSDDPILQLNDDTYFPPASTLKIVTALAAKLILGDEFKYRTRLHQEIASNADIWLEFEGDPLLTREHLLNLLKQYRQNFGNVIAGDIWLDDSHFAMPNKAIGWPWDNLGVCYSSGSTSIVIDRNCVHASLHINHGSITSSVPKHHPIQLTSDIYLTDKASQRHSQCQLTLIPYSDNRYHIQGCLIEGRNLLPLNFAIQDVPAYATVVVQQLLTQLNMQVKGKIRIGPPSKAQRFKTVAQHDSPKLPALLSYMLHSSNNLAADNLLKSMGRHYFSSPGSYQNGLKAMRVVLLEKAGINLAQAHLFDGSGLSRNNRMTARQLADVLRYLWKYDSKLQLISLLPVAGVDGTLRSRKSMQNIAIKQRIRAKSGSLYGTYNMIGYALNKYGKPDRIFVQLITDYYHQEELEPETDATTPLNQFEEAFYRDVLSPDL